MVEGNVWMMEGQGKMMEGKVQMMEGKVQMMEGQGQMMEGKELITYGLTFYASENKKIVILNGLQIFVELIPGVE